MSTTTWGSLPDGREVHRVELRSDAAHLAVLTWGATVQSLRTPDVAGEWGDIVLGFDAVEPYLGDHPFLGATVGRFANRIAGARFELDGHRYNIPANDGAHALHGGPEGFGRRLWDLVASDDTTATLRLVSPDGDMGFPGRLEVTTTFTVDGPVVRQETSATSDAPTVVNLTNHAYFNLHGAPAPGIADHVLLIDAEHYLPVDATAIPLPGQPAPVADTIYDFRVPTPVGRDLDPDDPIGVGYDHTWVLNAPGHSGLRRTALVSDPCTGRTLAVLTTQPGVQFYSGNFLDGTLEGRGGRLAHRSGLCLETQSYPDSPHRPDYPSTVLRPGETFHAITEWMVGTV